MIVDCITVGAFRSNCYVLHNENSNEALIIDAGAEYSKISDFLKKKSLNAMGIVFTHGHFDHINASCDFGDKVVKYIHENDLHFLSDKDNVAYPYYVFKPFEAKTFSDGEVITIAGISLRVLHTPGHTAGSVCLICGNVMFSGDTLFSLGIGRTDLFTGNERDMQSSLDKLFSLNDDYKVYPGHGEFTTLSYEREYNPYV